tara:strand:+ start:105 stop:347 length:243 start_codon:yes stop_codon:yes gene_type:complete
MGVEDLVISKFFSGVDEVIDEIDLPIFNGLAWLGFIAVFLYIVVYVLVYGAFVGHELRLVIVLVIWAVLELANLIGGGHN